MKYQDENRNNRGYLRVLMFRYLILLRIVVFSLFLLQKETKIKKKWKYEKGKEIHFILRASRIGESLREKEIKREREIRGNVMRNIEYENDVVLLYTYILLWKKIYIHYICILCICIRCVCNCLSVYTYNWRCTWRLSTSTSNTL